MKNKEKYHLIEVRGFARQQFNQVFGFKGHESKESVVQALIECFDPEVVDTDTLEILDVRESSKEEIEEIMGTMNHDPEEERTLQ